ncbi:extracellular solute-binding protein [Vitreoscilla sp. C1]|uniref:ABC transporter substrate-binding protein n=1 Tax=Vitreoscilla sp. (strain C1) TaxID=96942 RepID=UPI00148EC4FD|nr:ABC transporter substrate-binding protein [Vitreoscilla sp. C1]QJQ52243.1 extracellular solute-binding protein [Vitreoscilla sp. C1]
MRLKYLTMVAAISIGLSACGGDSTTASNHKTDTSNASSTNNSSSSQRGLTIAASGGTFQDALRTIYFEPFAKKIGQPVLEDNADSGSYGIAQAKVQSGNPNWDIMQMEAEDLARSCSDGLLEKIDWDKLGGKEKYLPAAVSDCGVGQIFWSTALVYDAEKIKDAPQSWADFWDVQKYPGKRTMRRTAKYALEFALLADGVKNEALYQVLRTPEGVDRAFKKLDELKPHVVWWDAGAQPLQFLASNEVVMAAAYNGRIAGLNRENNRHFKIVWPQSIYSVDSWTILKGASNKDLAMEFLAFASLPENQVKLPDYMDYGIANKEAASQIKPEIAVNLPTTEDNLKQAIELDADFWIDNSEELTQRFNAWVGS